MDSDAHIPFDPARGGFSARAPQRCDFPRFAQGEGIGDWGLEIGDWGLGIGDSRGRGAEWQTKPICPGDAPNEPNSPGSGRKTPLARENKANPGERGVRDCGLRIADWGLGIREVGRGMANKANPGRRNARDWGSIVVDLSWTSVPAEATLERTFFIAVPFLVLDHPGELDRRQVFMKLRELV